MTTTDKEHDSTFLTMPHMHAGDTSDLSTSFIFPSRSYEVQVCMTRKANAPKLNIPFSIFRSLETSRT